MAQYVKLGSKANFFRCSTLDISIAPGEVVALNVMQMNHPQIRRAINGGHLIMAESPKAVEKQKELSPEDLRGALLEMIKAETEDKQILKAFNLKQLTDIAALYEIEVEESDKKSDVLAAIKEELNGAESE